MAAGLAIFVGVSVLGYFMTTATHFYVLAILVGLAQGGVQGISRSLFASMIPKHKSGEFFGFYSVFLRFAAVVGPLLFGVIALSTGNSRSVIRSTPRGRALDGKQEQERRTSSSTRDSRHATRPSPLPIQASR